MSVCEQIVYAAKRAIVSGRLTAGTTFPSVRTLSRELKINPNTAHKVVTKLISGGLLESRPGVGTVVAALRMASSSERAQLLEDEIEHLVVESKKLGIALEDVSHAVAMHWKKLSQSSGVTGITGERKR
jgi:GntR family transcriptional regulator